MNLILAALTSDIEDSELQADIGVAEALTDQVRAPRTDYTYARRYDQYEKWCGKHGVKPCHIGSVIAYISRELWDNAPSTVKAFRAAVKLQHPDLFSGHGADQLRRVMTAHARRHGGYQPNPDNTVRPLSPAETAGICRRALSWNTRDGLELRLIAAVLWDTARRWSHLQRLTVDNVTATDAGYRLVWDDTKTGGDLVEIPHTCSGAPSPFVALGPVTSERAAEFGVTKPTLVTSVRQGARFPAAHGNPTKLIGVTDESARTAAIVCPACAIDDWLAIRPKSSGRLLQTAGLSAVLRRLRQACDEEGIPSARVGTHSFKKGHVTVRSMGGDPPLLIADDTNTSPNTLHNHYVVIGPFQTAQVGTPQARAE